MVQPGSCSSNLTPSLGTSKKKKKKKKKEKEREKGKEKSLLKSKTNKPNLESVMSEVGGGDAEGSSVPASEGLMREVNHLSSVECL